MTTRRPLIAANWKMNLNWQESAELVQQIAADTRGARGVDVMVAPPFTALTHVKAAIGNNAIFLGAQNMHWEEEGAYTGEIAGRMLLEAGCSHVILGHSERRMLFQETSEIVDRKVKAAVSTGLVPIVCVGERLAEREAEQTFDIVEQQLGLSLKYFRDTRQIPADLVLAYEPVWAIGTGRTATPEQAQEVHGFIRRWIARSFDEPTAEKMRILYGGSVKPDNIAALMSKSDLDGALVGGASLKADSFVKIICFDS